ncbi:MAG: PQQ-dependent sugar dehydrogenase [Acidimicrobiia bacterium]
MPRLKLLVAAATIAVAGSVLAPMSNAGAVGDLSTVHVKLTPVVSGLVAPLGLAWRNGDPDMYVIEQRGRIRRVANGRIAATALSIVVRNSGEQGLLGLAFSPNGTKAYVDYIDKNTGETRIQEYPVSAKKKLVKNQGRLLLRQAQPFPNHKGGQLAFGPDGMLYIGFGDGGGAGDTLGNGQNRATFLAKILRINPNGAGFFPYSIPSDNPFFGQANTRWEVWMYGLRNPWKFSFDRANGDMWIGDVGQALYEEIDYAPAGQQAGANWGWNRREGLHSFNGGTQPADGRDPVIERPHSAGDCAIIGGYVYRGTAIPALVGAYIYGDLCTGKVYAAEQQGGTIVQNVDLGINVPVLTSFGQDGNGEVYAVAQGGTVFRIAPA